MPTPHKSPEPKSDSFAAFREDLLNPRQLTGQKLYHYTTQEGLLGIVKSRSLWTTSILHLNDSSEFNYAFSVVRRRLESKLEAAKGRYEAFYRLALASLTAAKYFTVYVGSFSEEGDLLSQWRAYTHNGIGFSVGFHDTDLQQLALKQNYRLVKCLYAENEHSEIASRLIENAEGWVDQRGDEIAHRGFFQNLIEIAPLFKNPAFREEKEWRVVSRLHLLGQESEFRAGKSMLIPYREFNLEAENQWLRVAEFYVGPNPHVELAQASLAQLAVSKKIMNPAVVQVSQVPYRAW